jgi:two-component system response regulator MprA
MNEIRTVLLVEDDHDVRETVAEVLTDEGYVVVTAIDGREALDQLRGGLRPFVILLDLMMPGMNGYQFRLEQRAEPAIADIPVIVLTADRLIEQKSAELAAAAYLKKPTALDDLLTTLKRFQ